ncbi:MAG: spore coat protein CotJB [Hungatella hathewayi]|nr:spore coat protein CotJB [Hungatella hathewayi]
MRERSQCLLEIDEISFTLNDLNLYLDTHPEDQEALSAFNQASTKRKQLMEAFAKEFDPLTINCITPDINQQKFSWTAGPLPWDNQIKGGAL